MGHSELANSIVEITSESVEVWHIEKAQLVHDVFSAFTEPGWTEALFTVLPGLPIVCLHATLD